MLHTSDIPFFNFIRTHSRLPDKIFASGRKSKKLHLIYSLLSQQYVREILAQKNFLITLETLHRIGQFFDQRSVKEKTPYKNYKTWFRTLTIKNGNTYETYVFMLSTFNDNSNINILSYKGSNLISWLGGVVQKDDDIHISVQYNLGEDGAFRLLDLLNFIIELTDLRDFEQVYCTQLMGSSKSGPKNLTITDLIQIDTSAIRVYTMPAMKRKEHYRWQFCGQGRTILRQVKVKSTVVKEYVRRGKRI